MLYFLIFHLKCLLISVIAFLIHWSFRSMLFDFQIIKSFVSILFISKIQFYFGQRTYSVIFQSLKCIKTYVITQLYVPCVLKKSFPSIPFPRSHKHLEDRDSDMIIQYSAWIIGGTWYTCVEWKTKCQHMEGGICSVLSFKCLSHSLWSTTRQWFDCTNIHFSWPLLLTSLNSFLYL